MQASDQEERRFTYEIAPIFILMEHVVLKKMREIIGFVDGDSLLAPGRLSPALAHALVALTLNRRSDFQSLCRHGCTTQNVS